MKLIKSLKPLTNYVLKDSRLYKSNPVMDRYILTNGWLTYRYNYEIN
ncbi:hypothetical protein AVV30_gp103 [Vibrio phage phi 1]|uniref:Uncharacterized protein n=1 Tax=Vibrio phage phi 1 TaxID=1589297 RepID=A0A0B5GYJ3_9CAUD|nr:hypothetical protein AVV30_gp103 [Vibrio phage phi 1]AJF40761.1 hypothetical protein SBVP1_0103 [Vibrio phage phi 1]